jgi:NADH/NAD ratio-sensing transcriptional regulator Rex
MAPSGVMICFDICFEHTNASLKEIIQSSEYGKQVKLVGDKIRVDSNLITSLFDRGIGKAIHNIGQVLDRSDDKEVNTMIFVGNIANSYLFQHAVKTKYPEKQIITFY